MKITRRSFLMLIPVAGVAVASAAWWFLGKETARNFDFPAMEWKSSGNGPTMGMFDFPVTWNGDAPTEVNLKDYRLRVEGDVSNPLELSIEELQALPTINRRLTINCVEGWSAEVTWEGIPVSDLLRMAGAPKDIGQVTIGSVTGYNTRISGSDVANPDNMIALRADPAPLTIDHGYPARLVVPDKPGSEWVKYVNRIECTKS